MTNLDEKAEEYLRKNEEERPYGDGFVIETVTNIKQAYKEGWLSRDQDEHRKGIWFVTPDYEIECVGLNSCAGYVNPLFVGDYKSDCVKFIKEEINETNEYYKKWHDLRKDPNDLPNNNREVLVLLWNYDDYYIGHYERYYDDVVRENIYWHFSDFGITENKLDSVLAWCELPKFKE